MNYLHYDVFTAAPLLGNQLAVFPDARGLTTGQMQAIAREINFSETTFVFPPERSDTDVRMRIFTPAVEMPMAGHPTVGSTFALAHVGAIEPARQRFVFGLNVGPTPVDLVWDNGRLQFAWMTQKPPSFGPPVADRDAVARAIGLHESDLAAGLPIQEVTCGVPYLLVPLRDQETVDRATPQAVDLELQGLSRAHPAMLLFAQDIRLKPDSTYSRMFAPALGVVEDPATGSAAGPLGCYLVQHRLVSGDAARRMVNTQGVKMGRASRIHMAITGIPDAITDVQIGGEAVLVARGEFLAVPARAAISDTTGGRV
ncbi:MAG: PhzF family phenazine biosynthesis protein [Vicinamibacterales bacterium]